MTDQTEFTNTPTLIQISNVEFAAKALTDAEFDELTEWIRAQVLFTARRTVKNLQLPPEETREWYQDALVVISSMTWNSKEGNRILSSVDGFAYATWLMVRESQDLHKYDQSAFVKLYKQTQYPLVKKSGNYFCMTMKLLNMLKVGYKFQTQVMIHH